MGSLIAKNDLYQVTKNPSFRLKEILAPLKSIPLILQWINFKLDIFLLIDGSGVHFLWPLFSPVTLPS